MAALAPMGNYNFFKRDYLNQNVYYFRAEICQEDWIEIYNIYRDGSEIIVGRYCNVSVPGPVESNRGAIGLKVILHTDEVNVASGFKARYSFEVAKSIFGDCGGENFIYVNLSSII